MHETVVRIVAATTLAFASGSACAMTTTDPKTRCHVTGGAKLAKQSGGADALCAAIETALGKQAPARRYGVEITVLGSSRISALITTESGTKLIEQKYGSMDRELTKSSFERFASGLAAEVAKAEGRN